MLFFVQDEDDGENESDVQGWVISKRGSHDAEG